MRGVRAKALRRAAQMATPGQPRRGYFHNGYIRNGIPKRLDPGCTRAVYQRLKANPRVSP